MTRGAGIETEFAAIDRWVDLWDAAEQAPPDLQKFVAGCGPLPPRELADLLLIDQRFRWQAGSGIPAEDYLRAWPQIAADADLKSDLVYGEFRARAAHGKAPEWDAFVERFAEMRQALLRQAEVSRWLGEEASPAARAETPEPHLGKVAGATTRSLGLASPTAETQVSPKSPATRVDDFAATRVSAGPPPVLPRGFDPRAPLSLADFRLERKLGSGGMGEVFEALQLSLNKPVAIKLLTATDGGQRAVERFLHEARAVAALRHPHIVDVHGIGRCDDGRYFLVMDLVRGGSLGDLIARGWPEIATAAEITRQIAGAIAHANARGVIHRDLKPTNVLLDDAGRALVADFGLARSENSGVSASGDIVGTPQYMAPEQADDRFGPISPATDVYGIGGVFYALLTGEAPCFGPSVAQVLIKLVSTEAVPDPRVLRPDVPEPLAAICRKCLQKQPAQRFRSAEEIVEALQRWQGGATALLPAALPVASKYHASRQSPTSRRGPALLVLGAMLLVMLALFSLHRWFANPDKGLDSTGAGNSATTAATAGISAGTASPRWTVDVFHGGRQADRIRLTDYPGPVVSGDQIRVELRFARPRYVACFWLAPDSGVAQVYPNDPASTTRVDQAAMPENAEAGLPITGEPGTELCLAIVSDSPLPERKKLIEAIQALPKPPAVKIHTVLADGVPILQTLSPEELRARRPDLAGPLSRLPTTTDVRGIGPAQTLVGAAEAKSLADWLYRLPSELGECHLLAIPHEAK